MSSIARRLAVIVAALLTACGLVTAPIVPEAQSQVQSSVGPADASQPGAAQVVTWGASQFVIEDHSRLQGQTVRNLVHTSLAGRNLRISLSNVYGTAPVTFDSVYVGHQDTGAAIVPGTNRRVTFDGGSTSVTVQVGGQVLSDPLHGHVRADTTLAISVHAVGEVDTITGHNLAMQTSYLSDPGDVAAVESATAYPTTIDSWLWVAAVTVQAMPHAATLAFLGDSITDGHSSTPNANHRWPDLFFDRLSERGSRPYAVMNQGISGNRVLADGPGEALLKRFGRDVLDQPGVSTVFLLAGINDIRWDFAEEPDDLITAYRKLIGRAHDAGICVVGGTMTPFGGSSKYTRKREAVRTGTNAWIRNSGEFDGVVDFDAAVRDPEDPTRMASGMGAPDNLHPTDAGYAAMAKAVDLDLVRCHRDRA